MNKRIGNIILYALLFMASFAIGIVLTKMPHKSINLEPSTTPYIVSSVAEDGKVDINTADLQALQTLSGIGEKMAQRIIDYRTENGPYRTIENLMDVPGIGIEKFNTLKDYICASN